jgi:hypothetical protein
MSVKFDEFDELFFDIVLSNSKMFEDAMKKSLEYKLNITKEIMELKTTSIDVEYKGETTKHTIYLFSLYYKNEKLFRWIGNSNKMFEKHLYSYDVKTIFGSQRTLDKLFSEEYNISEKHHMVPPYLMAIANAGYNLVSFATPDNSIYFYAFVDLGIKDNFIFENFVNDMSFYKKALKENYVSPQISRQLKKKPKKLQRTKKIQNKKNRIKKT